MVTEFEALKICCIIFSSNAAEFSIHNFNPIIAFTVLVIPHARRKQANGV